MVKTTMAEIVLWTKRPVPFHVRPFSSPHSRSTGTLQNLSVCMERSKQRKRQQITDKNKLTQIYADPAVKKKFACTLLPLHCNIKLGEHILTPRP